MVKSKEKLLKHFEVLIKNGEDLKDKRVNKNCEEELDLWRNRVETLIVRVGGEQLLSRYNNATLKPLDPISRQIKAMRGEEQEKFFKLVNAINFLIILKEDIELFGNEESEAESKKLRRHFELEAGIPGVAKAKWGAEEK